VLIRLGYVPVMIFAPIFVAQERGYFTEEGLKVELTPVQGGSDSVVQLAAGNFDAAVGGAGAGLFNAANRGVKFTIVAPMHQERPPVTSPLVISAKRTGEIKSVADLKGKKIAINATGAATEYWLAQALAKGGLTMSDIQLTTVGFAQVPAALESGSLDAAILGEPTATLAEQKGIGVRLTTDFDVQGIQPTVVYGSEEFLKNDPEAAKGLMIGYMKAVRAIMERGFSDPEILPIIAEYTNLPPELITESVAPLFTVDGSINVDGLNTLQTFFRSMGELDYEKDIDPNTMIDRTALDAALQELDSSQ